ncbi:MAG TPA: peptidoglycan-binding domain-containing protein [Candidatus Pacearchaeota archaeon]|nr:peptidoglycan-binding domain-containing protein [Candidatus Pacearchaeota archaeon]
MSNKKFFTGIILSSLLFFGLPFFVAADVVGEKRIFNVQSNLDAGGRSQVAASLVHSGGKIYFYADDSWWEALNETEKNEKIAILKGIDAEFSNNVFPKLTQTFGFTSNSGSLTVLFHEMIKNQRGYIRTGDNYSKDRVPSSNEREMIYLNQENLELSLPSAALAHEYVHWITFNQKNLLRNVNDDVWSDEMRAVYSSTFLGYDVPFEGSVLEGELYVFNNDSSESLVEWQNYLAQYAIAHLLAQYIVDHYGINVLADSMKTEKTGIASVDYGLANNGFNIAFTQIFRDWLIALAVNNCSLGSKYCYKYQDLQKFFIEPQVSYFSGASRTMSFNTSYFTPGWQKIIASEKNMRLEFSGDPQAKFIVPYLACDPANVCVAGELPVAADGSASLDLPGLGGQYLSLTLMPFASGKTSGFRTEDGNGTNISSLSYSIKTSISTSVANGNGNGAEIEPESEFQDVRIREMLAQIQLLKDEIIKIQTILAQKIGSAPAPASEYSCGAITENLYFGCDNYAQVACLQEFLKNQGEAIYPQGLVTRRFSLDTKAAVIRFQEKYAAEVLWPLGLKSGTGYVGAATRAKINQLMK